MKLITDQATLQKHIPHLLASVKGETSLFEKISVHLELAEDWVRSTFTSDKTFNTIVGYTADNPIRVLLCRLVVAEALRTAIPSLDLVFTPNGFAVTQTSNLTPASKQRVDRLIGSMLTLRDDCIARLLPELVGASQWLKSSQAQFFGSTLFPSLAVVEQVGNINGSKWDKYLELRPQIIDLEASLAEEFISPELLDVLHQRNLENALRPVDRPVVAQLQAQIVAVLRGGAISTRRMVDCVNYIRQRPEDFPEWHNSATAKLFTPPVFKNKKNAPGYFF